PRSAPRRPDPLLLDPLLLDPLLLDPGPLDPGPTIPGPGWPTWQPLAQPNLAMLYTRSNSRTGTAPFLKALQEPLACIPRQTRGARARLLDGHGMTPEEVRLALAIAVNS